MTPTQTPTERQCDVCSRWYMRTSNGQRLCPECSQLEQYEAKQQRERRRRRAQLLDGTRKRLVFVVGYGAENKWPTVDDVLDFKNSMFFAGDFDMSLKAGCYPDGLVVKRYGHLRVVQHNRLVTMEAG